MNTKQTETIKKLYKALKIAEQKIKQIQQKNQEPIAVVGMACCFPGAPNVKAFWELLENGKEGRVEIPADRWNWEFYYDADKNKTGKHYTKFGHFIPDIGYFDSNFFNITPLEAKNMDCQQRLLLETSWHAFEDAGLKPSAFRNSNTGIFLGISESEYPQLRMGESRQEASNYKEQLNGLMNQYFITGNDTSSAAGRLSYYYGFRGPNISLQTACSSSLVATDLAIKNLRLGECDLAIAGGVNAVLTPYGFISLSKTQALSEDGRCKAFDDSADGYARGEGCGIVLLKRLSDAIKDGDSIRAIIKGSAVNQDGTTNGLTAPNGRSQELLIQTALKSAKVASDSIDFVEAHGTGTPLGDPIELEAIQKVYGQNRDAEKSVYVTGVKANVGHLETAAGAAGLIKTILCLQNRSIPPQIHFEKPNAKFDWDQSSIHIPKEKIELNSGEKLRAGVSSFGFSGTNAHLILEEYRAPSFESTIESVSTPLLVFTISAKSENALKTYATNWLTFLEETSEDIQILCWAAAQQREIFDSKISFNVQNKEDLRQALTDYVKGGKSSFEANGSITEQPLNKARRIPLPQYPFERKKYWVEITPTSNYSVQETNDSNGSVEVIQEQVMPAVSTKEWLITAIAEITELPEDEIPTERDFFDLGMDSLMIARLYDRIKSIYKVKINVSDFYKSLNSVNLLATFLESGSLKGDSQHKVDNDHSNQEPKSLLEYTGAKKETFVPYRKLNVKEDVGLGEKKAFLEKLIQEHNLNTQSSKELTQKYRAHLANNRNIAGFRPPWKEMIYQPVVDRAKGAKIWDAAGNEFLDFTMGFGVNLFGHNPSFIKEAIQDRMEKGFPLGPMTPLAGKFAKEICEMTGVDRVAFYNSGTEAVMVALRLARAISSRKKIVVFAGSYHGTFDGILAKPGEGIQGVPLAPGISETFMQDVVMLDYGSPESLKIIRGLGTELAAVLVETIQSRRPDYQPVDFLRELRTITAANETALIFDEVITGFRVGQKGIQGYLNIEADIMTYGKVIGGGLPIGIVGGKKKYLDAVDGGHWQYGDRSFPEKDYTFVAGTFCHHPLSMASGLAVVNHLKANPNLQEELNQKTAQMCATLNDWYEEEGYALKMIHFSSLFRFVLKGNAELLFFQLLAKGIYVWEGRNCFISTAHTDEDIRRLIDTVKECVTALAAVGFIRKSTKHDTVFPLSNAQRSMWLSQQLEETYTQNLLSETFVIEGELDTTAMSKAIEHTISMHTVLSGVIIGMDGTPFQKPSKKVPRVEVYNWKSSKNAIEEIKALILKEQHKSFDLENGPLIRTSLFELSGARTVLHLSVHHLVCDGWGLEVVFNEVLENYFLIANGQLPKSAPTLQYKDYVAWEAEHDFSKSADFWKNQLKGFSKTPFPTDFPVSKRSLEEAWKTWTIRDEQLEKVRAICKEQGVSLFMFLASIVGLTIAHRMGRKDVSLGNLVAARTLPEFDNMIGHFVNMIVLRIQIGETETYADFLQSLKENILNGYEHQDYPFESLVESLQSKRETNENPFFDVEISLQNFGKKTQKRRELTEGMNIDWLGEDFSVDPRKFDLEFRFVESNEDLVLRLTCDKALFLDESMTNLLKTFEFFLEAVLVNQKVSIESLLQNWTKQAAQISKIAKQQKKQKSLQNLMSFQ